MAGYVSEAVIRRLPGYYRHLRELEAEGIKQISSQGLGERMKLTASQIRQDINCFGGFGRQGYGYSVSELREHIGKILGVDHVHKMIILGAGNIGRAVALSDSFPENGFQTLAIFDADPKKIGSSIGAIPVQDIATLSGFLSSHAVDIAVMAVPIDVAQQLTDALVKHGVCAMWNFVPVDLQVPDKVTVVNVHLEEGLEILSFKMKQKNG
ncbi:MAG: redox-sensing transcriptional repressor Rex [Candidatus Limiplasma sp.]|nr:redox-sensing transcriptional repressor Rex [Candidatus Limiplasma sp.]